MKVFNSASFIMFSMSVYGMHANTNDNNKNPASSLSAATALYNSASSSSPLQEKGVNNIQSNSQNNHIQVQSSSICETVPQELSIQSANDCMILNLISDETSARHRINNEQDASSKIMDKYFTDLKKLPIILSDLAPNFLPPYFLEGQHAEQMSQVLGNEHLLNLDLPKDYVTKLLCKAVRSRYEYLEDISSLEPEEIEKLCIAAFELALNNPLLYGYLASDLFVLSTSSIEAIVRGIAYKFQDVVGLDEYIQSMLNFERLLDAHRNDINKNHLVFKNPIKPQMLNCIRSIRCFLSLFSGEKMSVSADVFAIQKAISAGKEKVQEQKAHHIKEQEMQSQDQLSKSVQDQTMQSQRQIEEFIQEKKIYFLPEITESIADQKVQAAYDLLDYMYDENIETLKPNAEFAFIIAGVAYPNFMRSLMKDIKKAESGFLKVDSSEYKNLTEYDMNKMHRLSNLIQNALDKYTFTHDQQKSIQNSIKNLAAKKPGQISISEKV